MHTVRVHSNATKWDKLTERCELWNCDTRRSLKSKHGCCFLSDRSRKQFGHGMAFDQFTRLVEVVVH